MAVNLRKISHSHSYSRPNSADEALGLVSYRDTGVCGLGHSNCKSNSVKQISVTVNRGISSTNENTSMSPTNLRGYKHTHSGKGSNETHDISTDDLLFGGGDCPASHTWCKPTGGSTGFYPVMNLSFSQTTETSDSFSKTNLRKKSSHYHDIPRTNYTVGQIGHMMQSVSCPAGHSNCAGTTVQMAPIDSFSIQSGSTSNSRI